MKAKLLLIIMLVSLSVTAQHILSVEYLNISPYETIFKIGNFPFVGLKYSYKIKKTPIFISIGVLGGKHTHTYDKIDRYGNLLIKDAKRYTYYESMPLTLGVESKKKLFAIASLTAIPFAIYKSKYILMTYYTSIGIGFKYKKIVSKVRLNLDVTKDVNYGAEIGYSF
jgi:hypothetical protein